MTQPDADEVDAYRAQARAWLQENTDEVIRDAGFAPRYWMPTAEHEAQHHAKGQQMAQRLHAAGYGGITLPTEYGGQGGARWQEQVFREEAVGRNIDTGFQGSIVAMTAPAILQHGTEAQKRDHLPGLVSGAINWCQLFSEPGAGSDLASLATRAVRDGEEFVINGQKVWNSAAMYAEWGILLVRTDPTQVKHRGITFLLFPMDQPGVEVRRLVQANGAGHFAEVFLNDARCPVANVLGEVDAGWTPTRTVMSNESQMIGTSRVDMAAKLNALARELDRDGEPAIRQRLADTWARQTMLRLMGQRLAAAGRARQPLPFEPAALKLYVAESRRREGDLAQSLLGPAGVATGHRASEWAMETLLMRFPVSIGGGTDEVQKNNLAERGLGLPKDLRPDRNLAWSETLRS